MTIQQKIDSVQNSLREQEIDGWLLYDFRRNNDLACHFLEIPKTQLLSRRFFYWIPKNGEPIKIVHAIENRVLNHLPGDVFSYQTWNELENLVGSVLKESRKIVMEYSPRNAIPYVSKVDAGTMDIVRGFGVEVISSADLLQQYTSVWNVEKWESHFAAARVLENTVEKVWDLISTSLKNNKNLTEYQVQQFMLNEFEEQGCITADAPICCVNANSANPHYCPDAKSSCSIRQGDFILIDLWCKQKRPNAVYADITRVGVAAREPTKRQNEIFEIVKRAQEAALMLVERRFAESIPVLGCEVDACCRDVIEKAGYGEFFIHRTGHNIDENDHGNGANIDSLETQDYRRLISGTCFSIEPGIYLPGEFGVRLEYDVFIHTDGKIQVTGGIQHAIKCLF